MPFSLMRDVSGPEEDRKRKAEAQKLVFTDALTKIKNATDNGTLDTNQANKMVQDMLTGKFTGLTPEVGGDFQPTGFLPNDPALAGIPPERMRVNPATGKLEMGMNKPKPIDYSSPDTYKLVDGKLTRVGEGKVNVLREPAPRETPEEAGRKARAQQDARNTSNARFGVGRTGSTGIKQTPEEKAKIALAKEMLKPINKADYTEEELNDARELLKMNQITVPGETETHLFGPDTQKPPTTRWSLQSGAEQPAPAPTGTESKTRRQNPTTKKWWVFKGGKWQEE